jgi:chromosome segregation ATPase
MVKRKSTSRKKKVTKKSSKSKQIATGIAIAATTTAAGIAALKAKQLYDRKKETSTMSVYDNVMSFFGFNKQPVSVDTCKAELNKVKEELNNAKKNSAEVDQCKAELNKIKEELNNAKKNGSEVDQCKSELNKINNELQNYKNVLDDYKKYENIIEQKYKELESDNKQLLDQLKKSESDNKQLLGKYNNLKADITSQDTVIKVLKAKISELEKQNADFQKKLVTK